MSKSILVIDTPKACIDCPCHFAGESGMVMCGVEKKKLLAEDIETFKPDWCPLKHAPMYKNDRGNFSVEELQRIFGYNECLEDILESEQNE